MHLLFLYLLTYYGELLMTDVSKLKEKEIEQLNQESIVEYEEEMNLEELIILGEDKKVPIKITFPTIEGKRVTAKALVKQLTLREMENIQINQNNLIKVNRMVLEKALFKTNGESYTKEELYHLPVGVVNAISEKILELSGMDVDNQKLKDF